MYIVYIYTGGVYSSLENEMLLVILPIHFTITHEARFTLNLRLSLIPLPLSFSFPRSLIPLLFGLIYPSKER